MSEPPGPDETEPMFTAASWWLHQARRLAGHLLLLAPGHAGLRALAGVSGEPDLTALAQSLSDEGARLFDALARPDAPELGLGVLAQVLRLTPFDLDLLSMALLPEWDERFGDAFGALRGNGAWRRPTLGLALRALVPEDSQRLGLWAWMQQRDLWGLGLLQKHDNTSSFADRELSPGAGLLSALHGARPAALPGGVPLRWGEGLGPDLPQLRPSWLEAAEQLRLWASAAGPGIIHLPNSDKAPGRGLAETLAESLGLTLLRVGPVTDPEPLRDAAICALLHRGMLCIELGSELRRFVPPEPWPLAAPAFLLTEPDLALELPPGLPLRRLSAPFPGPAEQAAAWATLIGDAGPEVNTDLLGVRTRLDLRAMREAVALARAGAEDQPITHAALVKALDAVAPDVHSPLASVSRPSVPWDALVLPPRATAALEDLRARVLLRATVQDRWGMRGSEGRGDGLVALLHGEPGTGKTFTAEVLASALGLPLLRIDLSRVVSKYIGETEKNLATAFDAAEGFGALLFFDEADALFGRRTAVKDSHDRYANLETNFLLQRLEAFEGLAVLATNALNNLDEAFLRRIPFVIPIPRPARAQQKKLWELYLPPALRAPDLTLEPLVARFDLVGGDIRSAAISAAYAAAGAGTQIDRAALEKAVREELTKKGKPLAEG